MPTLPLDEPVLDQRITLALTLHALGLLALADFDEEQLSHSWRSYQHVSIDVIGPSMVVQSTLAMRKYAIWGIYKAIHLMVASNDFRSRNYELYSKGALVGWVGFNNGLYGALGMEGGTKNGTGHGVRAGSLPVSLGTLPEATTNGQANVQMAFSFQLSGRTIGESNVFMTLFTGMLKAAPHSKDERVPGFFVNSRAFNSYLNFNERADLGPEGPFFEFEQLIELFTHLPSWMITHDSQWTEAEMFVSIDGTVVGGGVLMWQIRPGVGTPDSGDVVTS
ncbi:MAG: hypothetical protein Q9161_005694 [Pseudevernia consocians]